MLRHVGAALVALSILSGCVTERSGADFAATVTKVGQPKSGQARIVLMREKGYAGLGDRGWDIKLDGGPLPELKTGTYVYIDRPAGHHQLTATMTMFNGTTQRDVNAESGRTYFFLARPSEKAMRLNTMSAAAGLAGLVVAAAMTADAENPGPLDLFPLDDNMARTMIADLRAGP